MTGYVTVEFCPWQVRCLIQFYDKCMIHFMKTLFGEFYDKNEAVRDRLKVFTMAGTLWRSCIAWHFQNRVFPIRKFFFCFFFKDYQINLCVVKQSSPLNTMYFYPSQLRFCSCQKLNMVLPWLRSFSFCSFFLVNMAIYPQWDIVILPCGHIFNDNITPLQT